VNIGTGGQDPDGFVGIGRLDDFKPAFSITSAESIRNSNSSSTIKITGLKRTISIQSSTPAKAG
jgi:hypothetical protein